VQSLIWGGSRGPSIQEASRGPPFQVPALAAPIRLAFHSRVIQTTATKIPGIPGASVAPPAAASAEVTLARDGPIRSIAGIFRSRFRAVTNRGESLEPR
jgi:hypothetical protein